MAVNKKRAVFQSSPLKERRSDIKLLAEYLVGRFSRQFEKRVQGLTPEAMSALFRYDWPGGVSEMEVAMKRAILRCRGNAIAVEDLMLRDDNQRRSKRGNRRVQVERSPFLVARQEAVEGFEARYLFDALERNGWRLTPTAREVGIDRCSLRTMVKKHRLAASDPASTNVL